MDRRTFIKVLGATSALALVDVPLDAKSKPQIAITMDDPRLHNPIYGLDAEQINRKILDALDRNGVKAALFVCGMRVDSPEGRRLLSSWNDAGHTLGNHTYSHWYLPSKKITLQAFCDDIAKGETVLAPFSRFRKLFRFPFFKEGGTIEKRDGVRKFIHDRGYLSGRATIDASDWAVDARLTARLSKDAKADLAPYRDFYLEHMWERTQYYEQLSRKLSKKPVRHTVLIHHTLLNALFLDDLLRMYKQKGWDIISADEAYTDPIYTREPAILPAGESLIWALAKETGKYDSELRYPGESDEYENDKMNARGL